MLAVMYCNENHQKGMLFGVQNWEIFLSCLSKFTLMQVMEIEMMEISLEQ